MNNFRILLVYLTLTSSAFAAENGLWIEGKDRPERRVNVNLTALTPDAYQKVAEKVNEVVVNISTTEVVKSPAFGQQRRGPDRDRNREMPAPRPPLEDFFGDDFFDRFFGPYEAPDQRRQSLGSGFILNSDGYIVTNNHVVERADEIKVIVNDEQEFKAKVVGRDPKTDVALLKIEVGDKIKLKSAILGDSDKMKVGEIVVAIGNPFGLSHTVTQGIISAKERTIGYGTYDNFIQTDASINPGNSGGPLLNIYGEVIGINSAIVASGQGIGFAIPINLAKGILSKLKNGGKVVRGWLGVLIQEISDEHAKALRLSNKEGALVSDVQKESPAQISGFRSGDVIVSFDGRKIGKWNELPLAVAETTVGKPVKVDVIREGKRLSLDVKIGELKEEDTPPTQSRETEKTDQLGLTVAELTMDNARSLGIDKDTKGVLVQKIDESKPAFEKGIRRGDVVVEVNRKKVSSVADYRLAVSGLKAGETVLLLVKRGSGTLFVAFTL